MELLKELNTFMMSGYGALVIIGTVVWLVIGIILFMKVFCMGLIGCTRKEDNAFAIMYTLGCVVFWPGYLFWLACGVIPNIDWRAVLKLPPKSVYITCDGKGGKYKYIGIISHAWNGRPPEEKYVTSTGAGTSKGEIFKIYNLGHPNNLLMYIGFSEDQGQRRVYQDVKTGEYYHRTLSDFKKRMKKY